jgi:hypothetical protein
VPSSSAPGTRANGQPNAWKHGEFSAAAKAQRRTVRAVLQRLRANLKQFPDDVEPQLRTRGGGAKSIDTADDDKREGSHDDDDDD